MGRKMILIVEDDNDINNLIYQTLTKSGYECKQAFSGTEGIMLFDMQDFELVILDLMLPGMSGEDVLNKMKQNKNIPVIIMSAKDDIDSKIDLLSAGAEDYITKPFDIKELVARVKVQLRRFSNEPISNEQIQYKELSYDKDAMVLRVNGKALELTKQELKIMELFLMNPDKVFSKQSIYDYAWDDYYMGEDKTINVHISNIRKKIKAVSTNEYIETVWGIGFRLN